MPRWLMVCIFMLCLLPTLLPETARGQLFGRGLGGGEPVRARAVVSDVPLLPGAEGQVLIELTILPGYHAQSAFAAKPFIAAAVKAEGVPTGLSIGEILAEKGKDVPTPPALGTGTLSLYERSAYFIVPVKATADAPPGTLTLELAVLSQACTDTVCDPPKTVRLKVPVTIGKVGDAVTHPEAALFAEAQQRGLLPQPSAAVATSTGSAPVPETASIGAGKQVRLQSTDEQLRTIEQRPYRPFNADEHRHSLAAILLFALVGGLILNVMPCVLPVIPLKAVSFMQQAHGDHRLAMLHGLAFSAGIISLFAALAVALRVFGLFYGQQFQSPAFLITMAMFVVALALSMLDVWTISPPRAVYSVDETFSHRSGFIGSFSSGLMATLLATPCSAPFLGPVFAWALVQPAWLTALALSLVGLGMSLPYLVLAMFPQWLNRIPRAGRWSELLKQGLGIVMLGVAIYLVTLVPGTHNWPWVLGGGVVMALVCWGWGQIPTPLMSQGRIWGIRVVVVALGLGMATAIVWAASATRPAAAASASGVTFLPEKTTDGHAWLPFNVALLDEALKEGRPVVVDWTADWCINCRVLEAAVLSRDGVQQAVLSRNAVLLKADLSQENPPATALNRKLGGEAIPVLAIFSPSRPHDPVVLRDSYTQTRVIDEIARAR